MCCLIKAQSQTAMHVTSFVMLNSGSMCDLFCNFLKVTGFFAFVLNLCLKDIIAATPSETLRLNLLAIAHEICLSCFCV